MRERPVTVERHHTATAYVVAKGKTLLIWHRQLRMWLPPGGHCEANEDPVSTAIREVREETGLVVEVVPLRDLIRCDGPRVLPPPAVVLLEDIVRPDQPYHQHIDHVYFTRPLDAVDFRRAVPAGPHRWVTSEELAATDLRLPNDEGEAVAVADDVRLLGIEAIEAVMARESLRA